MSVKIKVVIDTQLFLRATLNRLTLTGKIVFEMSEKYDVIFSVETKNELISVLRRPKLRAKFSQLTEKRIQATLGVFESGILVQLPDEIPNVARDPKDNIFLACALVGLANYIVTEDQDLRVLHPYKGIAIIGIGDFWKILHTEQ